MPTFRKDLHLGHEVPLVETDDLIDGAITEQKMADNSVSTRTIQDGAVTEPKLADDAVSTRTIQDEAVTPSKLSDRVVPEVIQPVVDKVDKKYKGITDDLQNQIDSFNEHGVSVSNHFGDDPHIGISQKTLTEAFDAVWRKIEDITGEVLRGFSWEVTPTYFISEDAQTISVTAAPLVLGLKFEHIALYVDDVLLKEEEDVSTFSHTFEITDTSIVRCEAKILGVPYTRLQTVTHYNNFFLGAGSSYADIMDLAHVIPIKRGAYTIPVADGQRIFIVIGETLRGQFIRADINGMEIPFTETSVTVGGRTYKVFTSQNTYSAGNYNIDING